MLGEVIGKVFGTDKALSKVVDGVANGLDALVYTDEEKAGDAAKARSEARSMVIEWIAKTQGQNLARRIIALAVTGTWLSMYWLAFLMNLIAIWAENSTAWVESAVLTNQAADGMMPAVMLVLGFYFAAPHMGKMAEAALQKMEKK